MKGTDYVISRATMVPVRDMAARVAAFVSADHDGRRLMSKEYSPRTMYGYLGDLREQVMRKTNGGPEVELVDVLRAVYDFAAVEVRLITGKYLPDDERLLERLRLTAA